MTRSMVGGHRYAVYTAELIREAASALSPIPPEIARAAAGYARAYLRRYAEDMRRG